MQLKDIQPYFKKSRSQLTSSRVQPIKNEEDKQKNIRKNFYKFKEIIRIDDVQTKGNDSITENSNIYKSFQKNLKDQFLQRKFGRQVQPSLRDRLLYSANMKQEEKIIDKQPTEISENVNFLSHQNLNQSKFNITKVDDQLYFDVNFNILNDGKNQQIIQKIDQEQLRAKFMESYQKYIDKNKYDSELKAKELDTQYKRMLTQVAKKSYTIVVPQQYQIQYQDYNDFYKQLKPLRQVVIKQEEFIDQIVKEEIQLSIEQKESEEQVEEQIDESIKQSIKEQEKIEESINEDNEEEKIIEAIDSANRKQPKQNKNKQKKKNKQSNQKKVEEQNQEEVVDQQSDKEEVGNVENIVRVPSQNQIKQDPPVVQFQENEKQESKQLTKQEEKQEEEVKPPQKQRKPKSSQFKVTINIPQTQDQQIENDSQQIQEEIEEQPKKDEVDELIRRKTIKRMQDKQEEQRQEEEEKRMRLQQLVIHNDSDNTDSELDEKDMIIKGYGKVRNTVILDKLLEAQDLFDMNLNDFIDKQRHEIEIPEEIKFDNEEDKQIFNEIYVWKRELSEEIEEDKKLFIKEKKRIAQIFDDIDDSFLPQNNKILDISDSDSDIETNN